MKMVTGLASPHKNTWPPSQAASPSSSRRPMACRDDADVCLEVRDAGGNTGLPLLTHHAHRQLTRHGGQQARRR